MLAEELFVAWKHCAHNQYTIVLQEMMSVLKHCRSCLAVWSNTAPSECLCDMGVSDVRVCDMEGCDVGV